jgi:hypothetical protein
VSLVATPSEVALAKRFGVEATSIASARVVLNTIAALPWPEPERVSLLARLAHDAQADVGVVLARLSLSAAPLRAFDELIPLYGIAGKRTLGRSRQMPNAFAMPGSRSPRCRPRIWLCVRSSIV